MGEVAAGVQGHAEHPLVAEVLAQRLPVLVAEVVDVLRGVLLQRRRLHAVGQDRPERDQVGVDAGVRLGIGVRRPEQLARVLGGQRLDGVDVLAAGVEPVADRALGVLVAEPGAHRHQHGRRGVVLAGDQLERGPLVAQLGACGLRHTGLDRRDHLEHRVVGRAGGLGEALLVRGPVGGACGGRLGSVRLRHGDSLVTARAGHERPGTCFTSWTCVSHHKIAVCGTDVRAVRLAPMISSATTTHLVGRLHVDLGRTRSMICLSWPTA